MGFSGFFKWQEKLNKMQSLRKGTKFLNHHVDLFLCKKLTWGCPLFSRPFWNDFQSWPFTPQWFGQQRWKWRWLWLTSNEWVPKTQCFSSELQMGRILGQNFKHTQTNHLGNLPIQICFGQISEEGLPYGATELGWALEIGYWAGRLNSPHQIWTNIYQNPWKKHKGSTETTHRFVEIFTFWGFPLLNLSSAPKLWRHYLSFLKNKCIATQQRTPPCWSLETGEV